MASFVPGLDSIADPFLCADSAVYGGTADKVGDCAGAALPLVGAGWIRLGRALGDAATAFNRAEGEVRGTR